MTGRGSVARALAVVLLAGALALACSGRGPRVPPGPPPEYAPVILEPWDAGAPARSSDPAAPAAPAGSATGPR